MLKSVLKGITARPWLRISMAVALLIVGLAPIGAPIVSDSRTRLAPATGAAGSLAPSQPFAYRLDAGAGALSRIVRSEDGGATWRPVVALPQEALQVETVRGQEEHVVARSQDAIWLSVDGGSSWTRTGKLPSRTLNVAVGSRASGMIYAGTESMGLMRSADGGATWQPLGSSILGGGNAAPVGISALAVSPEDDHIVYAASGIWLGTSSAHFSPVGTYLSVDGGQQWLEIASAPLGAPRVEALIPVPGRPLDILASSEAGSEYQRLTLSAGLLALLDSADAPARAAAARAIALTGDRSAVPALLAHLHDPDALAGDRVAAALGTVGDLSAVPALMSGLDSSDEDVRSRSAAALGFLKASMATARLNEVLRKDGPAACRSAAEALARIGTPEAMTALLGPLGDAGMTPARHAAMIGLEVAGDRAGAPLALALNASDPTLRRSSAEMLGYLRQPASTPELARSLSDSEPAVRSQAAWALGEIGTQDAQTALAEVLASETDAASRQAATQALARARSLGDGKEPVSAAFGEQLLGPLPRIPAGRWTMLLLSLALSAALLLAGARRAHPRAH